MLKSYSERFRNKLIYLVANNSKKHIFNARSAIIYLSITTEVTATNIALSWTYSDAQLEALSLSPKDLTFYYWSAETEKGEEIPTTVDTNANTITAQLQHFSLYAVGEKEVGKEDGNNTMMYIIMGLLVAVLILVIILLKAKS